MFKLGGTSKKFFNQQHEGLLKVLDEEEILGLRKCLLQIMIEINEICLANDLLISLAYGSLLGAVRHKGFIPWDDDIDCIMPRNHYERLIVILKSKYQDRYELQCSFIEKNAPYPFLKIRKKGTEFLEVETLNYSFHKGVFIDVFPIENVPDNRLKRIFHGLMVNFLKVLNNAKYFTKWNPISKETITFKSFSYTFVNTIKYFLGYFTFFIPSFVIKKQLDLYAKKYMNSDSKFVSVPYTSRGYFGELIRRDIIFPFKTHSFERVEFSVPNNPDYILKKIYGDFMKLPKIQDQLQHKIIDLKL